MRTPLPLPKRGQRPLPIFGPFLLWPNGCMHQDATRYGGMRQPRGLCVRWGLRPPSQKGRSPQFSAHVYCGQTAAWIKMSLATEVGLGPDHTVLDGDPALTSPTPPRQFSAHFYCGQMAECIKMPLGMEVTFKESRFLEKTFPGKTFPGMSLSRKVVSRKRRFPERRFPERSF